MKTMREKGNKLAGMRFVITGTLPTLARQKVREMIERAGGKVIGSVSDKMDYLILGENPGSKHQQALALNKPVLNEKDVKVLCGL